VKTVTEWNKDAKVFNYVNYDVDVFKREIGWCFVMKNKNGIGWHSGFNTSQEAIADAKRRIDEENDK